MKSLRVFWILPLLLVGCLVAVVGFSHTLPGTADHRALREVAASPHQVYATLLQVNEYPQWHPTTVPIRILPGSEAPFLTWEAGDSPSPYRFKVQRAVVPDTLHIVTEVAAGPHSQEWLWLLEPGAGGGTRVELRMVERFQTPLARFIGYFRKSHQPAQDLLAGLASQLGRSHAVVP